MLWTSCASSIHLKYLSSLLLATPHPSPAPPNLKMNRNVGYSYPALPPGYQNTSPPGAPGMQASALQYPDGSKHFHQVGFLFFSLLPQCTWIYKIKKKNNNAAICVVCQWGSASVVPHSVPLVHSDRCIQKLMLLLSTWHQPGKIVPALP